MEGGAAESQEKSSPTSHAEGASVGKTTEDLYSVYLHGISQRSPQPQQQQRRLDFAATNCPASYSNSMLLHAVVTNNAVNYQNFARGYILPEPFYCLGFQQYPSLRHRALNGNLQGHPLPALPSRVLRIEGIPNANNVSAGGGSMRVGESSAQGAARHKRRMISQGNIVNFQGENLMAFDTSGERYTVYDNKYEEIGLPMDPHIRAFLANGNYHVGGSTSNA